MTKAAPADRYGDIHVDTVEAHRVFRTWLAKARPASEHSPDGNRRPRWLIRPVKPTKEAYRLPVSPTAG